MQESKDLISKTQLIKFIYKGSRESSAKPVDNALKKLEDREYIIMEQVNPNQYDIKLNYSDYPKFFILNELIKGHWEPSRYKREPYEVKKEIEHPLISGEEERTASPAQKIIKQMVKPHIDKEEYNKAHLNFKLDSIIEKFIDRNEFDKVIQQVDLALDLNETNIDLYLIKSKM